MITRRPQRNFSQCLAKQALSEISQCQRVVMVEFCAGIIAPKGLRAGRPSGPGTAMALQARRISNGVWLYSFRPSKQNEKE